MAMKTITYYEIVRTNFENFLPGSYPRGVAAGMKKSEKRRDTHIQFKFRDLFAHDKNNFLAKYRSKNNCEKFSNRHIIQVGDILWRVEGGSRCPNPLRLR
jgi:hypothetical protein